MISSDQEFMLCMSGVVLLPAITVTFLYRVARARGRSGHWSWLGLFPPAGLIAISLLLKMPAYPPTDRRFVTICPKCRNSRVAILSDLECKELKMTAFSLSEFVRCLSCGHIFEKKVSSWIIPIGWLTGIGLMILASCMWTNIDDQGGNNPGAARGAKWLGGLGTTILLVLFHRMLKK